MNDLPVRVREKLRNIDLEFTENNHRIVFENMRTIINILSENYATDFWVIQNMYVSVWEDDCIVIQWRDKNIYCFVYSNYVSIDSVTRISSYKFSHDENAILIESNEFSKQFSDIFSRVVAS